MDIQKKMKILLIDDDASLLLTLSDFLKFEGYDVMTADSGEQGLRKLARLEPDLIILDMSMPGMGGIGFLKEISNVDGKPRHPVLVLTARANMAEFFADVAVDGFIAKPCDPNDLLLEVGRIIFQRSDRTASKAEGVQTGPRKILIAEDDAAIRGQLLAAFRAAGYDTESVSKGPEVLEKAIVMKPDVIVLKQFLSSMNGDMVAGMLHEMPNTKRIPVVLYDERVSSQAAVRGPEARSLIRKLVPSNHPTDLLAAVAGILKP